MTKEEFVIWLKEFMEKSPNKTFNQKELKAIKNTMKKVEDNKSDKANIILSC